MSVYPRESNQAILLESSEFASLRVIAPVESRRRRRRRSDVLSDLFCANGSCTEPLFGIRHINPPPVHQSDEVFLHLVLFTSTLQKLR